VKKQINLVEAVGKTLQAVDFSECFYDGQCILIFSDCTFAIVYCHEADMVEGIVEMTDDGK